MLLAGWMGINSTLANFAWLANPLLLVTWILMHGKLTTFPMICSGVAAVLVLLPLFSPAFIMNEGGVKTVLHLTTGYWLWVGSSQANFIACVISLMNRSREEHVPSEPLF
jgi:hypothetical protein